MSARDVEAAGPITLSAKRLSFRWYLAVALAVAAAAGLVSPLFVDEGVAVVLWIGSLVSIFGLLQLRVRNVGMARRDVELEISERALVLRPGPTVPRTQLVAGSYSKAGESYWLKLDRGAFRRPLWLEVDQRHDARRVLDALGLGPRNAPFSTRVGSRVQGTGSWSFGAVAIVIPFGSWLATLAFVDDRELFPIALASAGAATLLAWFVAFTPTRVDVDVRGVTLTWFWSRRTLPFQRLTSIRAVVASLGEGNYVHSIELTTGFDEVTRLAVGHNRFGGAERASALEYRLEDALAEHRKDGGPLQALALLSED